jgi:Glycosyl hydrolase family 26
VRLRNVLLAIATIGAVVAIVFLALHGHSGNRGGAVPAQAAIYLGIYAPGGAAGHIDATQTGRREAQVGRRFAIDQHYYNWTDPFPGDLELADRTAGRLPLITWQPTGIGLADIASGRYDTMLRARARALHAYARPVLLRLAHEPNGDWYTWSAHYDRGPRVAGNTAATYVSAWRHVHEVFADAGAGNVAWVWSPNFRDFPAENGADHYYPGDDVVDWVGIDAYNGGSSTSGTAWTGIGQLIGPLYAAYAPRKPIMLTEVGSADAGGDKAAWVDGLAAELPARFPAVKAVVWFDKAEWRVDSTPAAMAAFGRLAAAAAFSAAPPR